MHMSDALLSPTIGGGFWIGTISFLSYSARKLKSSVNERLIPLMGVLGAFVFAAQMINFTIPGTGSSGHLGGGMLLAILLGPYAAFIVIASVLSVQALFFADGGLLALGSNIWNLGVYPCFIAYPLIYCTIAGKGNSSFRISAASITSSVIALELGAFSVVLQTSLSGIVELSFNSFLLLMLPIHLAIGLVEGIITAAVVNYTRLIQPDIISAGNMSHEGVDLRKGTILAFTLITLVTGVFLSWFASANPDGLEWSIQKITGSDELSHTEDIVKQKASAIQEMTSVLPDYNFPDNEDSGRQWPVIDTGRSISGLIGSLLVFTGLVVAGLGIRQLNRKRSRPPG